MFYKSTSKAIIIFLLILFLCNSLYAYERIVSLAPSITEILYALGLEKKIVGVTNFCDYPPQVKKKPRIGGMTNPSIEAVMYLKPDIVIMTTDGNPKEFKEKLSNLNIKSYVFKARRIYELPEGIRDLGIFLGVRDKAEVIAGRIEDTIKKYKSLISLNDTHISIQNKKAIFIIWPEPLIVAGPETAIDDTLNLLGWENIAHDTLSKYPKFSIEEIIHRSPDVIFIGKGHVNMVKLSEKLLKRLSMIEAVKKKRVYYTSDALYRLGPRIKKGIEELSAYLDEIEFKKLN